MGDGYHCTSCSALLDDGVCNDCAAWREENDKRITELEAENARLRGALEKVRTAKEILSDGPDDSDEALANQLLGEALAALGEKSDER